MKLPGIFKTLGNLLLNQVKKNPKAAALVVATVVGGSAGAAIKKAADKLPS